MKIQPDRFNIRTQRHRYSSSNKAHQKNDYKFDVEGCFEK